MATSPLPIRLRGVYPPPRIPTPVRLVLMTLSLALIAFIAVAYSLGYKVNWQTGHIQQTGIISVTPDGNFGRARVIVNGADVSGVPARIPLQFPGHYDIEVRKDGYQTWIWHTNLDPNKVLSAKNLVIVKKLDQMKVQPYTDAIPGPGPTSGISLRYNELWISGQFETRLSQVFVSAQWYPDGTHVAYQAGQYIRLYDTVTGITMDLASLPDGTPASFGFKDGGRTVVYRLADGTAYSASLYDAN